MRRRHPALPRLWLMTDERQGDDLWVAVRRLPRGAGIIFRHHATTPEIRHHMFERLRAIARRHGLTLLAAGNPLPGVRPGHHRRPGPPRFGTAPAHDLKEIRVAERSGAKAILLSPVFATRSHPGAPVLGPMRFAALCEATRLPVIALGGMDAHRFERMRRLGAQGWAAIDAWKR